MKSVLTVCGLYIPFTDYQSPHDVSLAAAELLWMERLFPSLYDLGENASGGRKKENKTIFFFYPFIF